MTAIPFLLAILAFICYGIAIFVAIQKGHGLRGLYWLGAFDLAKPGTRWYYRYDPAKRHRSDSRWPVDAVVTRERDVEVLSVWDEEDIDESQLDAITRRALRKARKR